MTDAYMTHSVNQIRDDIIDHNVKLMAAALDNNKFHLFHLCASAKLACMLQARPCKSES